MEWVKGLALKCLVIVCRCILKIASVVNRINNLPIRLLLMVGVPRSIFPGNLKKGVEAIDAGDWAFALLEWLPLAKAGDVDAQYNLGWMFFHGEGVEEDYVEAIKWFRLAAEGGLVDAQVELGIMYQNGMGVVVDYDEALKWYHLAEKEGNIVALTNLGGMYHKGIGVLQNFEEALRYYRLAAEGGNAIAQGNLGSMYHNGEGVERNFQIAYMWQSLAAAQGNELARENCDLSAEYMTSEEIIEAEQMARRCLAYDYKDC